LPGETLITLSVVDELIASLIEVKLHPEGQTIVDLSQTNKQTNKQTNNKRVTWSKKGLPVSVVHKPYDGISRKQQSNDKNTAIATVVFLREQAAAGCLLN